MEKARESLFKGETVKGKFSQRNSYNVVHQVVPVLYVTKGAYARKASVVPASLAY